MVKFERHYNAYGLLVKLTCRHVSTESCAESLAPDVVVSREIREKTAGDHNRTDEPPTAAKSVARKKSRAELDPMILIRRASRLTFSAQLRPTQSVCRPDSRAGGSPQG